jgi:hypothetical protein
MDMREWRYGSNILVLGIRRRRMVSFTPMPLYLGVSLLIGGCVGLRTGLEAVEKRKILHCRESNSGLQPVARYYADWKVDNEIWRLRLRS